MSLLAEKLAYLKKLRRLTTEQAARLTGVPVGTLNKIFSGQTRHPAAEHLAKLARLFRVPMSYLLDDEVPADRCYAAQGEEAPFALSAEEVRLVALCRRLDESARRSLAAMAGLLSVPARPLAGMVPVRRTFCWTAPGRSDQPPRPILIPENAPGAAGADFAAVLADCSMEPVWPPGTVLLCRRGSCGREEYGLYRLEGTLLVRRLVRRKGGAKLVSPNLRCRDIPVEEDCMPECLGGVLGPVRGFRWAEPLTRAGKDDTIKKSPVSTGEHK